MRDKTKLEPFSKFCNGTSLHGFKYLDQEMSQPSKIVWKLFIFAILILSSYVIIINVKNHINASTITTIDSVIASLDDITFPSFYICNSNQVT